MRENGHDAVMPVITLGRCLNDPNLFAVISAAQSWRAWKVFLAALFAEPADEAGLAVYRERTGRTAWPTAPFTEAAVIVGRRGGKSRTLALVAVYLACFRSYDQFLARVRWRRLGYWRLIRGKRGRFSGLFLGC